jgi:hypothetical protein
MGLRMNVGRTPTQEDKFNDQKKASIEQRKAQAEGKGSHITKSEVGGKNSTFKTKTIIKHNKNGQVNVQLGSLTYSSFRSGCGAGLNEFMYDLDVDPSKPYTVTIDQANQLVKVVGFAKRKAVKIKVGDPDHDRKLAAQGRANEVNLTNYVGKDPLLDQQALREQEANVVNVENVPYKGAKMVPYDPED